MWQKADTDENVCVEEQMSVSLWFVQQSIKTNDNVVILHVFVNDVVTAALNNDTQPTVNADDDTIGRPTDLWFTGRRFESWLGTIAYNYLGKLLTSMCLCHQAADL